MLKLKSIFIQMGSRPESKLTTDAQRFLWITTLWLMFKEGEELTKITGDMIEKFLHSVPLPAITRPALFATWGGVIKRSIEEEEGIALPSNSALAIRRWANNESRAFCKHKLYEPKQAIDIKPEQLSQMLSYLWFRQWANLSFKQTALISFIASRTGARTGECCSLYIEDMEESQDKGVTFNRFPLRSSKGNAFKNRRESLILPIIDDDILDVRHWLKVIIRSRTSGLIFEGSTTSKVRSHFKTAAKALGWGIAPTAHSLRVHFVVQSLEAGASELDIINVCRWKEPTLINTYRNRNTECKVTGSAYKIFEKKQTAKVFAPLAIKSPTEPAPDQIIIISDSPKKKQTCLVLRRPTRESETQTEAVCMCSLFQERLEIDTDHFQEAVVENNVEPSITPESPKAPAPMDIWRNYLTEDDLLQLNRSWGDAPTPSNN
jgi:hypothetical protein